MTKTNRHNEPTILYPDRPYVRQAKPFNPESLHDVAGKQHSERHVAVAIPPEGTRPTFLTDLLNEEKTDRVIER